LNSVAADDFGTNRKRVYDFLLVINSNFGPILHRFWDTAAYWLQIAYFSYPSLIRRPRSPCSLWNFAANLTVRKLESRGYPPVKTAWSYIHVGGVVLAWYRTVTDGRTVRQSDGQTESIIANTALCIAS